MRWVLVLALAGCHDLPDLGVCGNGVIEAENGEACDGDDGADTCTDTCELACQTSAVTSAYVVVGIDPATEREQFCPGGHACGVDNVCRAPSGKFAVVGETQSFDVVYAAVGDFDADRVDDLVGTSATKLVVRFGTSTGTPLSAEFVQDAPSSESAAVFFDREPDSVTADRSDVAVGIPTEGLALLASDNATFAPVIDGTFDVDDVNTVRIVVTDPAAGVGDVVVSVAKPPTTGVLAVKRIAIPPLLAEQTLPACGNPNSKLLATAVSRDRRSFYVIARTANPNQWAACEYLAFDLTSPTKIVTGPAPDSVVLANVDADACEELVTARESGPDTIVEVIDVVDAGTGCALVVAASPVILGTVAGSRDKLLAAGSIVPTPGVDRDELILTSGVFGVTAAPALVRIVDPSSADYPWTVAALVDLDDDGTPDVVAGRREQEDVDVVRGGAIPNVYRADTAVPVTTVVAGDYDGDGLGDAALVENSANGDRVSILYGTTDGTAGPARPNSRFQGVLELGRLDRFTWDNTTRGNDGIDDLVVIRRIIDTTTRGGVLIGEASRLLTMPRFPPAPTVPKAVPLGALAIGKLDGVTLAAAAVRGNTGLATSELTVIELGTGVFTTRELDGFEADTISPAQLLRTAGSPVIAVFAKPLLHAFETSGKVCTGSPTGEGSMHAVDLDADGLDELALVETTGDRRVRVFEVTGGAQCSIGEELLVEQLAPCVDVVRSGATIVTMCPRAQESRAELYRIVDDVREADPFAKIDGVALQLLVGDFDGDGVPDLAVGLARGGEVNVQVVRQCPAHDIRDCN